MFDAVAAGLLHVLLWPAPLYLAIGILIGLVVGAIPGLGGLTALALLLPFSFSMAPIPAFALLIGVYAVVTTGDSLSSILLGVPGTASAAATVLDGYPMALKGEAARALGASFASSAIGGVLGALILALSIPLARPLVLSFASPEFFVLALLGLTMVGTLSGRSLLKGLSAAALGAMLATVGYSPQGSFPRFTFDQTYLFGGLALIPLVLGLFSLPELLSLASKNKSIAGARRGALQGSVMTGVHDALREKWLLIRSTLIGAYVGLLPGIGGSVVDWLAYGHAVQTAKDKSRFGKGDVRGVIAPEAANNAVKGGDMIPTIAFGIPGSASMAVLLGAFIVQGIQPGPEMMTRNLDFTFSLVWMLAIANIIGAGLLLVWARHAARVTDIPPHVLVATIAPIVFMATWLTGNTMGDWLALLGFTVLGYLLYKGGWPRAPLILGFLLGSIMEQELSISVTSYGLGWLARPYVIGLLVLLALTLVYAIRRAILDKRAAAAPAAAGEEPPDRVQLTVSAIFAGLLSLAFAAAAVQSAGWVRSVGLFPLTIAAPAAAFAACVCGRDLLALRRLGAEGAVDDLALRREGLFLLWLFAIPVATLLIGQLPALTLFVVAYMRLWGRYSWRTILPFAIGVPAFLYLVFELLVPVVWYESALL